MKVAIIGAAGKSGTLLTKEALKQNHDVTAIVRHPHKLYDQSIKVIQKSIFDLTQDDLRPFDVVINAFMAAKGHEEEHITSLTHLIEIFKTLPNTRLIVVGGAGSLYIDQSRTMRLVDAPDFPEDYKSTASNMSEAFDILKNSDIQWTYMSPAAFFDPKGSATGQYTLGSDYFITNSTGDSYVSYADYSQALIDELVNKAFIRQRFTVVSENQ